jgi:hypothetical protein
MIPGVDMVNHSSKPNSFYEQTSNNSVALLLQPGMKLDMGAEVTISYGTAKTKAEMLFSYGFIDEQSTSKGLVLSLEPFSDDPLGKAKAAAFSDPPIVRLFAEQDKIRWESPFLYLMCLNEEDGLEFKVLQQTDGSRSHLKVFWQGSDVTDATSNFESLINEHPLKDVFRLRAVALLQDRIRQQLERLYESEDPVESLASAGLLTPYLQHNALQLRKSEAALLEEAVTTVGAQVSLSPRRAQLYWLHQANYNAEE